MRSTCAIWTCWIFASPFIARETGCQGIDLRIIHQIDLIEYQGIGERDLFAAFRVIFQMLCNVFAIDHSDDTIQP